MTIPTLQIGDNLRRLRFLAQLTQEELAEKAGLSRVTIADLEGNRVQAKGETLRQIARTLHVSVGDVVRPVRTLQKVRFRQDRTLTSREAVLARIGVWLDSYQELERVLGEKPAKPLPVVSGGPSRPARAADAARAYLEIEALEPVVQICELLERQRIKVYPYRLTTTGFFGLSIAPDEGGPAIVVNVGERISVERWIFTAAHELGHLILHQHDFQVEETEENEEHEREANAFAAQFLMPDAAFAAEWDLYSGSPFVDRVIAVKRTFSVSYLTVLRRLKEQTGGEYIGKFKAQYKQRYGKSLGPHDEPHGAKPQAFSDYAAVLRSKEPEGLNPRRFLDARRDRLLRQALDQQLITLARAAEMLGLTYAEMRERASSWAVV